jgi:hypothetical protein
MKGAAGGVAEPEPAEEDDEEDEEENTARRTRWRRQQRGPTTSLSSSSLLSYGAVPSLADTRTGTKGGARPGGSGRGQLSTK